MASITIDGVTVPAALSRTRSGKIGAGWMPDTEGLDFSVIATAGKRAVVTGHDGSERHGTVTAACREHCEVVVEPDP